MHRAMIVGEALWLRAIWQLGSLVEASLGQATGGEVDREYRAEARRIAIGEK